ncbi:ATP-dependent DNA helicase RecQ [Yimella sp. cx-51]|uniref:RecQ family ATP-dependent DNA helicase n=1 Tax=Yimella sp. cx-51 TaxID=2770551 RepID=UPI00165E3691|nr:DEAD/DEAH box helicase [Yimella sp. cx-51]MBC9957381.1 ATP-dependent DNA helicase RecQ [Yimella sp. cx-51]QTH39378.1 ATP-dependent DNA helicase RecQ [Yimella sp. cx-51]
MPTDSSSEAHDAALQNAVTRVLTALAGPDAALREGQLEALEELAKPGSRVLVVQATGWGKSAVYWIATSMMRDRGDGPTLVVSPLLSLMRDQVAAAERAGLVAATLNSSNIDAWSQIEADLAADRIDVLLVSPERLANPGFGARVMESLAGRLGMAVVDEAHAVSDWGHDFRPDYRRVVDVLGTLNPQTPVLATTATANERVVEDVAAQLGSHTLVLRGPLARSSLTLAVTPPMDPLARFAWVADHLAQLPGAGIIYTLTVSDAHRLAEVLRQRHGDDPALRTAAYTGALDGAEREQLEDALRRNELKALVATSALGMGYDKPDLGFVVHVGAPPSPVSYYQQVGRAGRAIDHALVALLPSASDEAVWDYFATATIPKPAEVERLLALLADADAPISVPTLEAESGIRRGRVELMLKQLAVDAVVERSTQGWTATGKEWSYDQAHFDSVLATRRREADIMRRYVRGQGCLMQLLQESLDDPSAAPCGRCSVCRSELPDGLKATADPETMRGVRRVLRTERHMLEPRKMWPGGAFGTRGKIPASLAADAGRVLVHADAPEWLDQLGGCLADGSAADTELLEHAVRTLADWSKTWADRPTCVISLAATGQTALTESVAAHLATAGRLPHASWPIRPVPTDLTGADEAAQWREQLAGEPPADVTAHTVVLVIDRSSSGWVASVATAALRQAGAARVLPLVIHRTVG